MMENGWTFDQAQKNLSHIQCEFIPGKVATALEICQRTIDFTHKNRLTPDSHITILEAAGNAVLLIPAPRAEVEILIKGRPSPVMPAKPSNDQESVRA